jgi:molybdopterin molybdotransferase
LSKTGQLQILAENLMVLRVSPASGTISDYDPNSLSVVQARQLIHRFLQPVSGHETLRLNEALHRTLSESVLSPLNVPPHDNSAMDGYALRFNDLAGGVAEFRIIGSAYAGHAFTGLVSKDECVRIMTGAPIPAGCDCVVMQEQVKLEGNKITVGADHRLGQNIRRMGEDIKQGSVVLTQGQTIRPAEMGLLASLGFAKATVYRKLRVALVSTGDELQQPGYPLAAGQIYDSNRYSLLGLLGELDVETLDMGSIPDDPASLKQALLRASSQADVIISSGGVSVGEADHIKQLLKEIGEVVFWKIAMKPGRPLAYGNIGECHFFGLPGNPVAVMVTFMQFVRDALKALMGRSVQPNFTFPVTCASSIRKLPGRTEFQRGILSQNEHGQLQVSTTGDQGSGILSSMSRANCFIVLAAEQGNVAAGSLVYVQPFAC